MNKEVFDKISKCNSVDEVLELAKANGKDITKKQAEEAFNITHGEGELTNDEIASVTGGSGCGKNSYDIVYWADASEVQYLFNVGDSVQFYTDDASSVTINVPIKARGVSSSSEGYYDVYQVDHWNYPFGAFARDRFKK